MAETIQEPIVTPPPSPFGSQSWSETPPPAPEVKEPPVVPPPATQEVKQETIVAPPATTEEVLDVKEWVKREFGWDDPELGKKELEELRQKAKTPAEIKYANEQSKLFHEALLAGKEDDVFNFLNEKRRLDKLTGSDVTKMSAEEILKYDILRKNKTLTTDEVNFLYNKRFAFPAKPVKELAEDDGEYAIRVSDWENQVQEKEREMVIEAKMAIPELQKLKADLVLPKIEKAVDPQTTETQQKELERITALRDQYLKSLESDYTKFNGYEIKYKDEEVEIPVNFGITDEEKVALRTELEKFDVDGFIMSRWFDKDGNPNIVQVMDDVTLLRNKEKVFQKMVNEVGSKMKEHYIKLKGNINVNGSQQQQFQPQATQQNGQTVSPFSANAWSEKPPLPQS